MSSRFRDGAFSSFLLVIDSFAKKLVGLASTLVLARVLLPEDFGIIAVATLMISFMDILANTGATQYLLRVDNLDEDKVNTSWTINFILKLILVIVMSLASFPIAKYYGDPRLTWVLLSLIVIFFCNSLHNPGLEFLRRAQNYKSIVKMNVIAKFFSAVAAVSAALILQSYWALVIGQAVSAILTTIGTYFIHSHRPKFKLTNAKEQWQFSGWMIPQAIFGYFRTSLDTLLVSSSFGVSVLGSYQTMKYIAFIPCAEVIRPLSQPFLVEFANSKDSNLYFAKQFKASLLLIMLIGLPISLVMFFHHTLITSMLLGDNWLDYSYLFSAFGLLIPAYIMRQQSTKVFLVFGKTKQLFFIEVSTFVVVYGVLLTNGIDDIRVFSMLMAKMEIFVSSILLCFTLSRYTGVKSAMSFILSIVPLLIASFVGVVCSNYVSMVDTIVFFKLFIITAVFFVTFLGTTWFFYIMGHKRLSEWEYLYSLIVRIVTPVLAKLKFSKSSANS